MQLTQTLRRAIQTRGNSTATVFAGRRHTWSQVGKRVSRLAGALRELGVSDDDRVAILAKNTAHWMLSDYAILMAGGVSVFLARVKVR